MAYHLFHQNYCQMYCNETTTKAQTREGNTNTNVYYYIPMHRYDRLSVCVLSAISIATTLYAEYCWFLENKQNVSCKNGWETTRVNNKCLTVCDCVWTNTTKEKRQLLARSIYIVVVLVNVVVVHTCVCRCRWILKIET